MAIESATASPELELARVRAVYAAGRVEMRAARLRLYAALFHTTKAAVRYHAAKSRLPVWLFAVVTGSVGAVVLSVTLMAAFNLSPAVVLGCVLSGYGLVGGGTAVVLWSEVGETAEGRLPTRLARYMAAYDELDSASKAFKEMRAKLLVVESALASLSSAAAARPGVEPAARIFATEPSQTDAQRNYLLSIDPRRLHSDEFENFIAEIFGYLGYQTTLTGKSGDQGVDVIAEGHGMRIAIQVKRYNNAAANNSVQQVFAGMVHWGCQRCVVVTCSRFTASAQALAQSVGCVLVDGEGIPLLINGQIGF
jgi:HJR/Mrr/RecB family endonuclease